MILTFLLYTSFSIWGSVKPGSFSAGLEKLPPSDRESICHYSSALFTEPSIWDHDATFQDSDSELNAIALNSLLIASNRNEVLNGETSLRFALKVMLRTYLCPPDPGLWLINDNEGAMKHFREERNDIPATQKRARALLDEAGYISFGYYSPDTAAAGLERFSFEVEQLSPTIAQKSVMHAIRLLRRAGEPAKALAMYKRGKSRFEEGNPSNLGAYWKEYKPATYEVGW
jgi:hypothetical protein